MFMMMEKRNKSSGTNGTSRHIGPNNALHFMLSILSMKPNSPHVIKGSVERDTHTLVEALFVLFD
jgi:hypothetical protein